MFIHYFVEVISELRPLLSFWDFVCCIRISCVPQTLVLYWVEIQIFHLPATGNQGRKEKAVTISGQVETFAYIFLALSDHPDVHKGDVFFHFSQNELS